ncbi:MAG TPA: hypothetical protein VKE74_01245 [Gemmataceae bacterium]|nr:hypothetical protein [Gemmataceae bacterium]
MDVPKTLHPPVTRPREADRLPADDPPVIGSVTIVVAEPADPSRFAALRGWLSRNRTVILFVVFLVATDQFIGLFAGVWARHSPDDYAARVEGCRSRPRDVVFVGGSPVAEGIDPDRITGIAWCGKRLESGYALGLSGGTTSDFYHAVIRGCHTPPRLLVYGITASDINDSRNEPHGPYSLMSWGDLAAWVRLRPDSAEWVIRHFLQARLGQASNLFRYRHGIRMWLASEADGLIPGCCPEASREADESRVYTDALRTGNGYAPSRGFQAMRYDAVKAAGLQPQAFPYLLKYRTGSHLKYLHRLIDWCGVNGVRLILIDMPVTADLEAKYPAEFAEYRVRLAEIERTRGLMVIRATREATGLTDAHFADLIHMNRDGARVFSDWVRVELESCTRDAQRSAQCR